MLPGSTNTEIANIIQHLWISESISVRQQYNQRACGSQQKRFNLGAGHGKLEKGIKTKHHNPNISVIPNGVIHPSDHIPSQVNTIGPISESG